MQKAKSFKWLFLRWPTVNGDQKLYLPLFPSRLPNWHWHWRCSRNMSQSPLIRHGRSTHKEGLKCNNLIELRGLNWLHYLMVTLIRVFMKMIYSKTIIIIVSWLPRDWTGRNNRLYMLNDCRHGVVQESCWRGTRNPKGTHGVLIYRPVHSYCCTCMSLRCECSHTVNCNAGEVIE